MGWVEKQANKQQQQNFTLDLSYTSVSNFACVFLDFFFNPVYSHIMHPTTTQIHNFVPLLQLNFGIRRTSVNKQHIRIKPT